MVLGASFGATMYYILNTSFVISITYEAYSNPTASANSSSRNVRRFLHARNRGRC